MDFVARYLAMRADPPPGCFAPIMRRFKAPLRFYVRSTMEAWRLAIDNVIAGNPWIVG